MVVLASASDSSSRSNTHQMPACLDDKSHVGQQRIVEVVREGTSRVAAQDVLPIRDTVKREHAVHVRQRMDV